MNYYFAIASKPRVDFESGTFANENMSKQKIRDGTKHAVTRTLDLIIFENTIFAGNNFSITGARDTEGWGVCPIFLFDVLFTSGMEREQDRGGGRNALINIRTFRQRTSQKKGRYKRLMTEYRVANATKVQTQYRDNVSKTK